MKTNLIVDRDDIAAFLSKLERHREAVLKNATVLIADGWDGKPGDLLKAASEHDVSKTREPERSAYAMKYVVRRLTSTERKDVAQMVWRHKSTNRHHPEYWSLRKGGIPSMPDVNLAEMACDIMSFQRNGFEDSFSYWNERMKPYYCNPAKSERHRLSDTQVERLEGWMRILKRDIEEES